MLLRLADQAGRGKDSYCGQCDCRSKAGDRHACCTPVTYTTEQIEALITLLEAPFAGIKTLQDITTH